MKMMCATILLAAIFSPVSPAWAQQGLPQGSHTPRSPFPEPGADASGVAPLPPSVKERLAQQRLTEQQKKMIADTDRLLQLATELKADMDKTTKDTMSIEVIKKADEIEKLAHSVKERMKG